VPKELKSPKSKPRLSEQEKIRLPEQEKPRFSEQEKTMLLTHLVTKANHGALSKEQLKNARAWIHGNRAHMPSRIDLSALALEPVKDEEEIKKAESMAELVFASSESKRKNNPGLRTNFQPQRTHIEEYTLNIFKIFEKFSNEETTNWSLQKKRRIQRRNIPSIGGISARDFLFWKNGN